MGGRSLSAAFSRLYERVLMAEIEETPDHVAIIQDGNRRFARKNNAPATHGHRVGARTTEELLGWCRDLDIDEVTLYTFSTENFNRPEEELQSLFSLIAEKLREFARAEEVHEHEVNIRVIGDVSQLPDYLQDAIEEATTATADYDAFYLNIALAYGGRWELLRVARELCHDVATGEQPVASITVDTIEDRIRDEPTQAVDLIVRTGGDERTSNFLPWHANGNEAAVYFSTPYWPEFSKADFLRGIRTYQNRQRNWQRTRARRILTLMRALKDEDHTDEVRRPRDIISTVRKLISFESRSQRPNRR